MLRFLRPADDLGTYAQHAVVDATVLAPAPRTATAAEAASLPLGGLTAYQALDQLDQLGLPEGGSVLVTGAAGAVGGFLVQLRTSGNVTSACRPTTPEQITDRTHHQRRHEQRSLCLAE